MEQRSAARPDGTSIGYQLRGSGPAVVLANGLGGSYQAFRAVYDGLGERYRILCWDYRGLATSEPPRGRAALDVRAQCDDLELLLDREGIDRAVVVGWSMGVQVALEFCRKRAHRIAGLVAINGTYGRPFHSALSSRYVRYVVPTVLRAMRAQAAFVGAATSAVIDWRGVIPLIKRVGLVSATLDVETFYAVAEGFKTLDWDIYTRTMELLGEHDAGDVLRTLAVPALIVTGDRDILTPVYTAEKMHRQIAGSRLVVIEGGTHYTPVEYPRIIQDELARFLARVEGWS